MILTDILEKTAKKYPNAKALTMRMGYRNVSLTFQQVYEMAKKVALFLEQRGMKKGDKVLIFAQNSPYWGSLFWGILLRGAIAVPLNVQSTSEMIRKIAEQTESKIIFKSRFLRRDLPKDIKTYEIDFLDELIESFDVKDFKKIDVEQNDLIEILYTSGTTGDPKGVLLTHRNIVSNVQAIEEIFTFKPCKEIALSILPLTHIFEQTIGLFLTCMYAAHVIYAHSYAAIFDLMQEYRVTKMLAVPEFLKLFLSKMQAELEKKKLEKKFEKLLKLSSFINNRFISRILFYPILRKFGGRLDTIACGGAFLDPELEKQWNALGITILQGFGLTETSPAVSCNTYKERKLGSVGKVVKNVEVKITEDGEIWVKGPNVFQGYFKNEEKTKESFTSDGWFKTGDIGEFDKDGFLFLKGRKKYVIIGPGAQNVFPEDIEFELNKIDGVKDSCVVGLDTPTGMVEIHAVLLLADDAPAVEKIVELANEHLASYQQITGYSVWPEDDFPRSATRKVKKEEVLKFLKAREEQKEGIEKKEDGDGPLIKILSQLSGVGISQIKKNTKIIQDLKFDSLMLVELIMRVEQDFGILIDQTHIKPVTTVFDLQEIINKKEPAPKMPKLKKWPRSWWAKLLRPIGQFLCFLFYRIFIRLKIEGEQNLKDLKLPVIFMPNHLSYIDGVVLLMSLPYNIREKITFAAARDVLYEEYKYVAWLAELFFNAFALSRLEGENVQIGLEHMGRLLDKGYSVVVFPEGKMSLDGKMLPLKKGAGLMAVEMDVYIVPIKLVGTVDVVPYAKTLPRRFGKVIVKIGKPIKFKKSDSYDLATEKIEKVLKEL